MNTQVTSDNVVQRLGLASYEMSNSINLAQRAFKALLKTCLSHHGLTIPQWTLLGHLYANGSARPVLAAKVIGLKPPYIAKLIAELEATGLITADTFPDDARGKAMKLTDEGIQTVERVEIMLEECLNHQLGSVKQADLQTYFMLTKYIAQHVRHHD